MNECISMEYIRGTHILDFRQKKRKEQEDKTKRKRKKGNPEIYLLPMSKDCQDISL